MPALGHGGEGTELVPRIIEAFAGKPVIGAAAGESHTASRMDRGRGALSSSPLGCWAMEGHGATQDLWQKLDQGHGT